METGIVILAAGNSSRLGQPKQLLQYNGYSLIRNAVVQAKLVPDSQVVVVTGAHKTLIDAALAYTAAKIVHNHGWQAGMASSITTGLHKLLALTPSIKTCLFTVCDQPFVTSQLYTDLLAQQAATGRGIVASAYAGTLGTPVLFHRKYFERLLRLNGQEGAKKLLSEYSDDVAFVPFEKGAVDIDTIEDYNNLITKK